MVAFGAWADVLIALRQSQATPKPLKLKRRRAGKSETQDTSAVPQTEH